MQTYGKEQNIKIAFLDMLNKGQDPFFILQKLAELLEESSGEKHFAKKVQDIIETVYGIALEEKVVLETSLERLQNRYNKMEQALSELADDAEKKRLQFALTQQKKYLQLLQGKLLPKDEK